MAGYEMDGKIIAVENKSDYFILFFTSNKSKINMQMPISADVALSLVKTFGTPSKKVKGSVKTTDAYSELKQDVNKTLIGKNITFTISD